MAGEPSRWLLELILGKPKVSQGDQMKEELELEASLATSNHRKLLSYLDFNLQLARVSVGWLINKGRLECQLSRGRHLLRCALVLLFHYFFLKFTLISSFQYELDRILKQWAPRVRPGAPTGFGHKCALAGDILLDQQEVAVLRRAAELRAWLRLLGNPMMATRGTGAILAQCMALPLLFLPLAAFYLLRSRRVQLDFLSFILRPQLERQRCQADMDAIVGGLVGYARRLDALSRRAKLELVRALVQVRLAQDTRPINLSADWHKRLVRLYYLSALSVYLTSPLFVGPLTLLWNVGENMLRAGHRLDLLRCQSWAPGGSLLAAPTLQLAELEEPKDRQRYLRLLAANESAQVAWWELASVGLALEHKANRSAWNVLTTCEYTIAGFLLLFSIGFYFSIFLFSSLDKLVWLLDIEQLLARALHLLRCEQHSQVELVRLFALFYINFCLFHKRFAAYKLTSNLLIGQLFLAALATLLGCYLVATRTAGSFSLVVVGATTYPLALINLLLLMGAYLYSKVSRLMLEVQRVQALLRALPSSPTNHFISEHLLRVSLSAKELQASYALSLTGPFGAAISYAHVITFNFYLVGLWRILFAS